VSKKRKKKRKTLVPTSRRYIRVLGEPRGRPARWISAGWRRPFSVRRRVKAAQEQGTYFETDLERLYRESEERRSPGSDRGHD